VSVSEVAVETIVLKFEITEKDLLTMQEFMNFEIANPFSSRKNIGISYFLIILGVLSIFVKIGTLSLAFLFPVLVFIGILMNFQINSILLRLTVKNMYKNGFKFNLRTNIMCEFYVHPDYLILLKDSIKTEVPWGKVKHIAKYQNQILCFLDITDIIIIPKKAFTTQDGFDSFYEKVLSYLESKKSQENKLEYP
jgi:hypothetical protein